MVSQALCRRPLIAGFRRNRCPINELASLLAVFHWSDEAARRFKYMSWNKHETAVRQ